MPELTLEDAKKDVQVMVEQAKAEAEAQREANMPPEELAQVEAERKKEREAKSQAEAKAKADEALLAKKEEERSTEEQERVKALLDEKRKAEEAAETAEQKIRRVQEQSQKRIDEISNELKQVRDKNSKEADDLRRELQLLRSENENLAKKIAAPRADDTESLLAAKENERIAKYLNEDKAKAREARREMSNEELETWLLEDIAAAQRWISRNESRRDRERQADAEAVNAERRKKEIEARQIESARRVNIRHPELQEAEALANEFRRQGKDEREVERLTGEKYPKYRVLLELGKSAPKEVFQHPDFPEIFAQEMERRINAAPAQNKEQDRLDAQQKKIEELEAKIAAMENQDIGINSNTTPARSQGGTLSSDEKVLVQTMKDMGLPENRIQDAITKKRASKVK